jgi:hypothetical protein
MRPGHVTRVVAWPITLFRYILPAHERFLFFSSAAANVLNRQLILLVLLEHDQDFADCPANHTYNLDVQDDPARLATFVS